MIAIKNNRGAVDIRTLFWVLVIASSLYASYKFLPPAVTYHMMKTEVEEEAKIAHMHPDEALVARILDKAKIWSAPIERHNIEIVRHASSINISVQYTMTISFFGRWERVQDYSILVEKPLKGT